MNQERDPAETLKRRTEIRKTGIANRNALSKEERDKKSALIVNNLSGTAEYQVARTVMIYRAVKGEVNIDALEKYNREHGNEKTFLYPLCVSKTEMVALMPKGEDFWREGYKGIIEPVPEKSVLFSPEDIDLVVCPCTAFDENLNRSGMGSGFYDRFLDKCRKAKVITVAFECQKTDRLEPLDLDIPMQAVITEEKVYGGKSEIMNYQEINSKTIDKWVEEGWEWGIPIDHETFVKAKQGDWNVLLTPTVPVPREWFGELKGKRVLGLASGGGQQMPVFTAAGAECTVLDYSEKQLESERTVAAREGYSIEIVRADMTKRLPFEDETFDLIFHPVSNDYVKDVYPIFRECFRVLKKGGVLLAGLSNEINFIVSSDEKSIINRMPFDPIANEEHRRILEEDDAGMQFSHTAEEQIGGQLKAGLTLCDIFDDTNGSGYLHEMNIKTFIATKAVKK